MREPTVETAMKFSNMHEPCASRRNCYHSRAGKIGGRVSGRKAAENGTDFAALGRIGSRNQPLEAKVLGGRIGGRIQGRRNIKSGQISRIATLESCARGGRIGGRKAVESGQLASITTYKSCSKGGSIGGLIAGRKAVKSGQLASVASRGGQVGGRTQGRRNVKSGLLARIAKGVLSTVDGVLFRSQTEAMFYCIAKELGGEPVYEPNIIELDDGTSYTPDFILGRTIIGIPANVSIELKPARNAYYNGNVKKAIKAGAIIVYWDELVDD